MISKEQLEEFKHYVWGENRVVFPDYEFIIKLTEPRVYIKYKLSEAYFSNFEEFYKSIAEVQWIDGVRPSEAEQKVILINMWNYLALEERLLEQDLENMEDDDF